MNFIYLTFVIVWTHCVGMHSYHGASYFACDPLHSYFEGGWLGRAMVLGSFQCQGVLLLRHMVGQGPAVLAASAGRVGCFFFFLILSVLSFFSNASSLGRWLDVPKYCGLGHYNPTVAVSYYRRRAHTVLVNRLARLSLPRNSVNG